MTYRTVGYLLAAWLSMTCLAQAQPAWGGPALLFHGNYCGPGNNAPLTPVDALDAACARHDACYPASALPSRRCNLRLQWEADRLSRDPRLPDDLRALAGFVAAAAALLPFDPNTMMAEAEGDRSGVPGRRAGQQRRSKITAGSSMPFPRG
jgi:hypothetical protein